MTIWKFPFAITDRQFVTMPDDAEILRIEVQDGLPCLWAMVDPSKMRLAVMLATYGTGHQLPNDPGEYLGTYQVGGFVGHVFRATQT